MFLVQRYPPSVIEILYNNSLQEPETLILS